MSSNALRRKKFADAPDGRGLGDVYAMTIDEVRDEWARRSGQDLTRARIWQILVVAEKKLREQLAAEFSRYVR